MANCDHCGCGIPFGGTRDGEFRYCNFQCHESSNLYQVGSKLPDELVKRHLTELHQGRCPKCNGPGPVDIHKSYIIWSVIVMTFIRSRTEVCCQRCGFKSKFRRLLFSGIAGWWCFPFGWILTPVQIYRNLASMITPPEMTRPSSELRMFVVRNLAIQEIEASSQQQTGPD